MAKVICSLPNASHNISGVAFVPHPDRKDAKVSEEISDEQAAAFTAIPGYELVGAKKAPTTTPSNNDTPSLEEQAELADLRSRGLAAGIPFADKMGLKRLRDEVPPAEEAKKAADANKGDAGGASGQ